MNASALITEWFDVPAQTEAELSTWQIEEHEPAAAQAAGIVKLRRYRCDDAPLRFLDWYDTAGIEVEAGADFTALTAAATPLAQRIAAARGQNYERMNFALMRDVGRVAEPDTPWLYIVHTDIPDDIVGEYNEWYDKEHLPRLVTVPGVVRARRYTAVGPDGPRYLTAYELTDRDAFESPAGLQARKTPWTARMRSLFTNTRRRMCRLLAAAPRGR